MNGNYTGGGQERAALMAAALVVWSAGVCGAPRAASAEPVNRVMLAATVAPLDKELLAAALRGDSEGVRALLARGADVEARDPARNTPLAWASSSGDAATVGILLAKGARVNVCNEYGVTPLARAVSVDSIPIVRILLKHGADPNVRDNAGRTVLMAAAEGGLADLIPVLRAAGADVEAVDDRGRTALIHAAMRDINLHAECNTPPVRRRMTEETLAAARALIAIGAPVSVRDKGGRTAAMWAERMKNTALLPILSKPARAIAPAPRAARITPRRRVLGTLRTAAPV
ncbi:hypothetical protein CCAX7_57150 [Capsulimonas corticalis]|uniref:Uncharacterized protein n=1 Tax=Capsulimonas corticalis TaxID=2219043 RepID=A0A402D0G6_9BACT|nr:ankyrin repeat domain-containing protein [Capsulimonas corticalis]BDI33664.1 hypothetical protein CCAX7_57150 [Capsulimonas corticalis]